MFNRKLAMYSLIILLSIIITTYIYKEHFSESIVKEEYDLSLINKYEFLILHGDGQFENKTVVIERKDEILKVNKFLESLEVTTVNNMRSNGPETANVPNGTIDIYFSDNRHLYFEIEQLVGSLNFSNGYQFANFKDKNHADLFKLVLECSK